MKASDELSSLCCSSGIVGRLGGFETGDGFLQVVIADGVGLTGSFAAGDGFAAADSFAGADSFFATGDCFATGDGFAGVGRSSSPLLVWVAESASCFPSCFIDTAVGAGGNLGKTVSLNSNCF